MMAPIIIVRIFVTIMHLSYIFLSYMCYEDLALLYQIFSKCNKIVTNSRIYYHYNQRPSSNCHKYDLNNDKYMLLAYIERYEFVKQHYPSLISVCGGKVASCAIRLFRNMRHDALFFNENRDFISILINSMKKCVRGNEKMYMCVVAIAYLVLSKLSRRRTSDP